MSTITFLVNGLTVCLESYSPTMTLLNWLREHSHLTGTKEGCNEGDCGACTVMVSHLGDDGKPEHRALNACILFLTQLNGKAVRTVEGLACNDDALHPVQDAMIDHHASQCGFCTPGFVMSLATQQRKLCSQHTSKPTSECIDDVLAGNLCRCTGYAAIVRAGEAAMKLPSPEWLEADIEKLKSLTSDEHEKPKTTDHELYDFAAWYQKNPDATLVAGGTDVGLWVTKQMRDLPKVAFISDLKALQEVHIDRDNFHIGAAVKIEDFKEIIAEDYPAFSYMLRRYGALQIRNAASIGGNIANGSPIGDCPPPLLALGATLELQSGQDVRKIPLEDFFIDYGQQDCRPGEFVRAIKIPRNVNNLKVYKLSKRFDQDISAVCSAFAIEVRNGIVVSAQVAFGGMAAIPKRAAHLETFLLNKPWSEDTLNQAQSVLDKDFSPISDMRASNRYRRSAAYNLLWRYFHEFQNDKALNLDVLKVMS